MAAIYKRPNSKIWQCAFYVKNDAGELVKVRKSTGHTNRKLAVQAAVEMERSTAAVVGTDDTTAARAKSLLAEAVREIELRTFTAPKARKLVAELLAIATGEDLPEWTVKTWCEEWLRRKSRDSSKATMARYSGHLKSWLDFLGAKATNPLESITAADARAWRESLIDAGRGGKTVAGYCKDANAVFRAAIREGILTHSPFGALEAVETSDSQTRKPFIMEEVAALMAAAPTEEWRGLILLAAFTGLRLADAAGLRWNCIDLQTKTISVMPSKTRRKKTMVHIPIQPDLLTWLESAPLTSDEPDSPVFPVLAKAPVGTGSGLSAQFVAIMAAAGVDRGKPSRESAEGKGAGRITWERGFHSLRHTFTSWLANAGIPEETRMALTGHSTRDAHQIYTHADAQTLTAAISKLPSLR